MRFAHDTLTGGLVIIAPRRALRLQPAKRPGCPFCPGAEDSTPPEIDRISNQDNDEWAARAVPNLFPLAERHEVHILSPRHILSTSQLTRQEWTNVVTLWQRRLNVAVTKEYHLLHLFVNDGRAAGASMDHLHSQLVEVPSTPRTDIVHDANRGAGCAACQAINTHQELIVWQSDDLIIRASDAPASTGQLTMLPRAHSGRFDELSTTALSEGFHALCAAAGDEDRNIWISISSDHSSHWFTTLLPRSATLAGVELGLGVGVSLLEPADSAAAARERLRAATIATT